jgi:hypothetical protein
MKSTIICLAVFLNAAFTIRAFSALLISKSMISTVPPNASAVQLQAFLTFSVVFAKAVVVFTLT